MTIKKSELSLRIIAIRMQKTVIGLSILAMIGYAFTLYLLDHAKMRGVSITVGKSQTSTDGRTMGEYFAFTTRKAVIAAMYPAVMRCKWASNQ